jgi:hypothetical protein
MSRNGTKKEVNNLKPYYSEFVRHCLRYYIKTLDEGKGGHPIFRTEADKENWSACYNVLKDYSEDNMEIISEIYRPGDTIADKIYLLAKTKGVSQDRFWSLVNVTERKIAKKRGLL